MSEPALPCIVCGRELRNVFDEADNQPNDGVVFTSHGNYGSTVFDDFIGQHLEVNLCDPCLVRAGEQGRVLLGQSRSPVKIDGTVVGWESVNKPLAPWRRGSDLTD